MSETNVEPHELLTDHSVEATPIIHRVNGRVRWVEVGTTHYVADKDFYGYVLDRTSPPRMVCIFDTEREMRNKLLELGIAI
jgi:hypothetical protein